MQRAPADPLSFGSSYSPTLFFESALLKGPSRNASKPISEIHLWKDIRRLDGHWRHEFLVFTIINGDKEIYLYFERELDEDLEGWKAKASFAQAMFQGDALDMLMFHSPGSTKDIETKSFSKAVFAIKLKSSPKVEAFTLKDLATILKRESYEEKYQKYGLFSANCWAWSRGLLFDIIYNLRVPAAEILKTNGAAMVPITAEEMKLYMLTEYGAYGRLLLHFSSADYNAQSRTKGFFEFFNPYLIRIILMMYSILHTLVKLKSMIIGPSNWTSCLRTLLVYHDRTLESSMTGRDCTFLPLPPNFADFIPVIPGHMDYDIPDSFCQPGKYLYLLTSPIFSSSHSTSAVHIHAFGATSDVPGSNHEGNENRDSLSWLSCGIIRRSQADGRLIEVPMSDVRLVSSPCSITAEDSSPTQYSAIHVFDSTKDFTRSIQHGDMIALWAHSYPGRLHTPRSASIKIVVSQRPVRIIDVVLGSALLFEIGRFFYLGGSYISPAFSVMGCVLYWTNTFCERWLWDNLSSVAKKIHASVTPLSLPRDLTSIHSCSLPVFLQEPSFKAESIDSDVFSASILSLELFQESSGKEIVIGTFSHQLAIYVIHFIGPSTVNVGWLHYLSFLSTPHCLEDDEVRVFQDGETERTVRQTYRGQTILRRMLATVKRHSNLSCDQLCRR